MPAVHATRSAACRGAKSHAAAGLRGADSITDIAVARSAPQQMNPTPIGKISCGVWLIGNFSIEDVASLRRVEKLLRSVPEPMNPRPPARETASAKVEVDIDRIGAETMKGPEIHGYVDRRALVFDAILGNGYDEQDLNNNVLLNSNALYQRKKMKTTTSYLGSVCLEPLRVYSAGLKCTTVV